MWEYRTLRANSALVDSRTLLNELDSLGEQGWELVLVYDDRFYLKKKKTERERDLDDCY